MFLVFPPPNLSQRVRWYSACYKAKWFHGILKTHLGFPIHRFQVHQHLENRYYCTVTDGSSSEAFERAMSFLWQYSSGTTSSQARVLLRSILHWWRTGIQKLASFTLLVASTGLVVSVLARQTYSSYSFGWWRIGAGQNLFRIFFGSFTAQIRGGSLCQLQYCSTTALRIWLMHCWQQCHQGHQTSCCRPCAFEREQATVIITNPRQ